MGVRTTEQVARVNYLVCRDAARVALREEDCEMYEKAVELRDHWRTWLAGRGLAIPGEE